MPDWNLRRLSSGTLALTNLLGKTSLKKKVDWKVFRDKVYVEKEGIKITCDVYVPNSSGMKPAILVAHPGGWSRRSRKDTEFYSEQLAGQGYVVVNCTYRLAPQYIYPSSVEDIRDCYHWMVKHSQEYQIDTQNIGAMGYSSGAHLISLVTAWSSQQRPGYADVKFKVVALGGGVYDFMVYPQSPYINRYTTFYRDENVELYQDASPIHQLGTDLPYFFLFHSYDDELIEHDQMMRFAQMIQKKGGKVETYTIPTLSHGYTFVFSVKAVEKSLQVFDKILLN
jgi:acetyl esterase/lipase